MFWYQIRIALKSLLRNPVLSAVMICAVALGVGVSTTFVTGYYIFSLNPVPQKSDVLCYVEMDSWDPNRGWSDNDPKSIPNQITYRDMVEIMKSEIPTHQGGSFKASLFVHPDSKVGRPFKSTARMCFADFFSLFEPPFEYGGPWPSSADKGPDAVIVLDSKTNQKVFGGQNSVGRMLKVEDREFKVVGVLKPWNPRPKYYDTHNGAFEETEGVYLPFEFFRPLKVRSAGNTSNWKSFKWDNWDEFLASEAIWIQMWVQLDTQEQRDSYMSFLNSYVEGQKKLGRMLRPTSNKLLPVMQWLKEDEVVPEEATTLMVISLLFLLVCSLNLIGILLGKFLARAPEISVRRALGANRKAVFLQHLIECETVAVIGGILGILVAVVSLRAINGLFTENFHFELDLNMLAVALVLSLIAGLVAGAYPAWRICSIPPAAYLRER
jgi:putative ABC transport system permease protein